jgi:DNA ligase (NAD+)
MLIMGCYMEQINLFDDNKNIEKNNDIERIEYLKKEIEKHNNLYYNQDNPVISDYEYDKLNQELKNLIKLYPEYTGNDKIGGENKEIFSKVEHIVPMQSLNDVFDYEDVVKFLNKLREEYGNIEFVVETKIDGLSVSLDYVDGKLLVGSTRGNGEIGENVTDNILCIDKVQKELNKKETIEVRAEVYLSLSELERLNKELEKNNKKLLANTRNAAAGTLRQLNTELVKSRNLSLFVFNVQKSDRIFKSHSESLKYCKDLGMNVIEHSYVCKSNEEVLDKIKLIGDLRDSLEYDIDGAVVKVNDLKLREVIGTTIKVPKWAVAFKYPPEQKETKILDIIVQVGRTGQVTPMAILEPVRVAGSLISKTTLHNFDYIKQKDIRIGDTCVIQKAGDVIPEVDRVLKEKRNGTEKEVEVPTICPICKEKLYKDEDIVALRCVNSECEALIYRSIVHFVSKDCMNISGLRRKYYRKTY